MATDDKQPTTKESSAKASTSRGSVEVEVETSSEPRRRKYSRGLKDTQVFERQIAKASRRVGNAVAQGFDTYLERRDRSALNKRDGALVDFAKNASKGLTEALRELSEVPDELGTAFDTKSTRRTIKFIVRSFAFPLPFIR
jgi:uncharacterized protein Yka (UPF0111/DUF47 family)